MTTHTEELKNSVAEISELSSMLLEAARDPDPEIPLSADALAKLGHAYAAVKRIEIQALQSLVQQEHAIAQLEAQQKSGTQSYMLQVPTMPMV